MDGSRLRELRLERGLSLNKLGEVTGISKSYLSFLERDIHKNPSLEILAKIAKALDVDIDYFINDDPSSEKQEGNIYRFEISVSDTEIDTQKVKQLEDLLKILKKD